MPDRKVLAIAGDGGFLYQMGELATAVRHNIAVVVVVFDNGAFGNVKRIQQERYGNRLIASDLHNPDFVQARRQFRHRLASRRPTPGNSRTRCTRPLRSNAPALV